MNIFKEIRTLKRVWGRLEGKTIDIENDINILRDRHIRAISNIHKRLQRDSCHHTERKFYLMGDIYIEECSWCGKELMATDNQAEWEERKLNYEVNFHTEALERISEECRAAVNEQNGGNKAQEGVG